MCYMFKYDDSNAIFAIVFDLMVGVLSNLIFAIICFIYYTGLQPCFHVAGTQPAQTINNMT